MEDNELISDLPTALFVEVPWLHSIIVNCLDFKDTARVPLKYRHMIFNRPGEAGADL